MISTKIFSTVKVSLSYLNGIEHYFANLFAGCINGVFLSTNKGSNWEDVHGPNVNALLAGDTYLYAGTDDGVWRRPLSDFGFSTVTPTASINNSFSNFPNPFSHSTTISFILPESGEAEVSVVNLLGYPVSRLFEGELAAGEHSFTWDAREMPPGMYECVVRMNGYVERTPMMVSR